MRLSPFAAVIAACVLTLTACGDDGDEPSSADNSPSASESDTAEPSGKGSKDPKGGKNTETGDARPDGGAAICDDVDPKDIGKIVGTNPKVGQTGNGCLLTDPSNPAGTSVGLTEASLSAIGGEEGLKTALTFVKGEPEELSDLGDLAYLVVGKGLIGGTAAAGAVVVEDTVVQVQLTPSADVSKDTAREQAVALLELVAETL